MQKIVSLVTFVRFLAFCLLLATLVSCDNGPGVDRSPAVGHAYVGPQSLKIRQELNPRTPAVATLAHGEKLDIIEYRRRFVKVRTARGVVGWTDTHELMSPDQMQDLENQSAAAEKMPAEGVASVFETLNVHSEPSRQSPGFQQLKEGTKVTVVEHRLTPRVEPPPPPILAPVPKPKRIRTRGKLKEKGKIPPPPMPQAPLPPRNWVEMSKAAEDHDGSPVASLLPTEPPKPIPLEDWYLIRTSDGKAGWVLSRMVSMAIPDEVAQYAEGHRITSYFSLGKVNDDGNIKDNWLWTTITKGSEPYEFDSFRVFVWSRRHHRYETAYVQRNVVGHYPISVDASGDNPSFKLILEGDDGALHRNTYVFNGYRVNLVASEPYVEPGPGSPAPTSVAQSPNGAKRSWYASIKARISKLFNR